MNLSVISPEMVGTGIAPGELKAYIGETVGLHGTVYNVREMSGFAFVFLQTVSGLVQCVWAEEFSVFPVKALCCGMAIDVTGTVVADERSKIGAELRLVSFRELSRPYEEAPFAVNGREVGTSLKTLLDYRALTLRNNKERAIFRLQAGLCEGFRRFFAENGFTEIHTPKLVAGNAEGGAEVFRLDYFGKPALLAQSPQLYKQAMTGVFERVYEIGPVFRAEKHDTARHLNEYTGVDLEVGFIEGFEDLMRLETKMLIEAFDRLRESCRDEIALLEADIPIFSEIPAIRFSEAKKLISKTYCRESGDGEDFEPEEERQLCDIIRKETGSEFVFVTHYKSSKRPFYAMDTPGEPDVTESFDLLFRGQEITTGGQRIHSYTEQVAKMRARGLNPDAFAGYLMAHKYGLPPHGGLGLGLERLTARLLGFDNVRRAALFPRDVKRLEP